MSTESELDREDATGTDESDDNDRKRKVRPYCLFFGFPEKYNSY